MSNDSALIATFALMFMGGCNAAGPPPAVSINAKVERSQQLMQSLADSLMERGFIAGPISLTSDIKTQGLSDSKIPLNIVSISSTRLVMSINLQDLNSRDRIDVWPLVDLFCSLARPHMVESSKIKFIDFEPTELNAPACSQYVANGFGEVSWVNVEKSQL
ncbi:MAG: hypothetical protein AB8B96_17070 [Lysobacterales bacterium]